jgi:adenylate cyclase
MPSEIEVKYLVKQPLRSLDGYRYESIRQGYIVALQNENTVRIRLKGDRYYLTIKGVGMMSRREVELELAREQFEELWPLTEGRRIEKTRYYIDWPPHLIELDLFEGNLKGLVMAEVEFDTEEDVEQFVPPDWFDREVTWDSRYQNSNLAKLGKPTES